MNHTYFASQVQDSGHILALCTCDTWRSWQYSVPPAGGLNESIARNILKREHDRHVSDFTELTTKGKYCDRPSTV